ncbi:hypothetical protein O6R05_03010 [Peptoniphilus equinus]|uniref:Uncharacterized protein n=1 Tax=Peptoniphilus equinus TaxID=3016343 RepID=A0ABY7QUR8_9FIRM|nr:hypothetical protein [Peptoniphilus equinus]WBW50101.1 hypothetical protein O6R05_00640 [Peptoniphilus equinus]WBW50531.1 hypothetical protein O6R05_03010 [Peptoniphilus equinus]
MITKEDLERKFTLKNKIVVTSPKGISTELKRKKDDRYVIKKDESEIKLNDLKDLTEYCKVMCIYRNNEKVTEDLLENAFKLRDTIILHKSDKSPVKVVKEKIYNYTLDNQDTVIPFKGTESIVAFLKQNNFSL